MMRLIKLSAALLFSLCLPVNATAQRIGWQQKELIHWNFNKQGETPHQVTLPHSCNALDGHSERYYRGTARYTRRIHIGKADQGRPTFLLFQGAAQAAQVSLGGHLLRYHKGGYTPFCVNLTGLLHAGDNEIEVETNNHEDITLAPVTSDFNKNNGLHNPVFLLQMNEAYLSPEKFGLYRLHVSTPSVTAAQAQTVVETHVVNTSGNRSLRLDIILKDKAGNSVYLGKETLRLRAGQEQTVSHTFSVDNPHLWNGLSDPYLYTVQLRLSTLGGRLLDEAETAIGYRFFRMDKDKGFFLNGRPYPLRGVAIHQDMHERASAPTDDNIRADYEVVRELGANFVRLAHYPHRDLEFRLCDSLGIMVQTEIPWVNDCGPHAGPNYFKNLHQQLEEMIINLYNHPSIGFWGLWNEVRYRGKKASMQGETDPALVVSESNKLYLHAKRLEKQRYVGLTDCRVLGMPGYDQLQADYVSENRYNGWYYKVFNFEYLTKEMTTMRDMGRVSNIAEYGGGINPFCHTTDSTLMAKRKDDSRHYEEYGNLIHETHWRQIVEMPWLNFTSLWILFDFPVAARTEGYMDSDDGVNFTENPERKYMNDKGLITRDRKTRKDPFYLYKAAWNKQATTVHITSKRMHALPAGKPVQVKVYSNAPSLTLYQNGQKVATMQGSGEQTGVIYRFGPLKFQHDSDTFRVVAPDGTSDEVTWRQLR